MYYNEEKTQQEIADVLGLSRIKVLRLLQQAREKGIVQIKVHTTQEPYLKVESDLRLKFHLRDVIITREVRGEEAIYNALARAAGEFLSQFVVEGMLIGVGLSYTLSQVPQYIQVEHKVNCTFLCLTGGLTHIPNSLKNQNIVVNIANAFGGQAIYIMAPFIVSNLETRTALLKEKTIQESFEMISKCQAAIASLGTVDINSMVFRYARLEKGDLESVRSQGGVGDILGRYFDKNGNELKTSLSERTIGPSIEELKSIPTLIIVAGGPKKYQSILAALRGEIPDILITDMSTAQWLLQKTTE